MLVDKLRVMIAEELAHNARTQTVLANLGTLRLRMQLLESIRRING